MSVNYRQKAKDLVNLATDERTPEKERGNAVIQALRLIKEHDLLSSPFDTLIGAAANNETMRAATSVFSHLSSPEFVESMKTVAHAFARKPAVGGGGGGRRTSRRR
jgi:hypothetical protein